VPRKAYSKKQLGRGSDHLVRGQPQLSFTAAPDLSLASWGDAERLFRVAREAVVPVESPFVLISQTQRSGGTLMNTLLDGHPRLQVHPYELHIGHPSKGDWPTFDLEDGVDKWLEVLHEDFLSRLFADGYRKKPDMRDIADFPVLPFTLAPSFLERLFRILCAEDPPRSGRQILERYLTAFFNAWLDCQGLRDTPKSWVVGFCPRLGWGESRARFFRDYPDGRLIALHRDPRAWYSSARLFSQRYGEFDEAMALWRRGAEELLAAKAEDPKRVFALTYERLVREPEPTMLAVANWLEIEWHAILLEPTFNRQPTVPNSSFRAPDTGIRTESLGRWRNVLEAETVAKIGVETLELDAAVRNTADLA
jgi:hypothetical protein